MSSIPNLFTNNIHTNSDSDSDIQVEHVASSLSSWW
jgi:hypothetical protein